MKTIMKNLLLSMLVVIFVTSCGSEGNSKIISTKSKTTTKEDKVKPKVKKDVWDKVNVVDKFGDPTGSTVYTKNFKGVFSNSAVENRELLVKVIEYDSSFVFKLYEHGRSLVRLSGSDHELGDVTIKDEQNNVKHYEVFSMNNGNIYIGAKSELYQVLKKSSNKLKFLIRGGNFSRYNKLSNYNFSITTR
jgi:hypothetical protein